MSFTKRNFTQVTREKKISSFAPVWKISSDFVVFFSFSLSLLPFYIPYFYSWRDVYPYLEIVKGGEEKMMVIEKKY